MCSAAQFTRLLPLTVALLGSAYAQQASSPPTRRTVMVSVIDKQGKAITDLKKDDFRARLRGQAVSVVDARYSLAPRRLIVLMDVSGSMGLKDPTAKWQIAREALNDLLEQTPRDVPIAMLSFAGEVRDVIDFSRGRDAIKGWLKTPPV